MPDFIPSKDADLLAWAANFSTLITAGPVALGLTAANATTLAGYFSDFQSALTAATDPGTRGSATVLAKNTAKATLVAYCRQLARAIQGTLTVTDQQRHDLGLTVRDTTPTHVPAPDRAPQIVIQSIVGRTASLKIIDPEHPTRRGRPPGVDGIAVFTFVGETAPEDPTLYKFEGNTTTTEVVVQFPDSVARGAMVWFTAFYFNPRAQSGPACAPISGYIQYGGSMAQ